MSLRDPFNPQTGVFAKNVRVDGPDDASELMQSLQKFGWIKEFPALVDEHGVTLVGHRRLKVARALGIEPVTKTLTIGSGEAADAERLKLALASNLGGRGLSKEDRKHIAMHLYGTGEWTMERIAEALNVSRPTIVRDLDEFVHREQIKPAKSASNPKGAGRPKGSGRLPIFGSTRRTKPRQTDPVETQIIARAAAGEASTTIAADVGVEGRAVRHVIERDRIRREAQAEPVIDRETLSLSAQQKLDAALRQHKRALDLDFHNRVNARAHEFVDSVILPDWRKKIEEAKTLYKGRTGLMTKGTFDTIRRALHPDSRASISEPRLADAFRAFMELEKFLLAEKDSPTEFGNLPSNLAEWDRMRARAQASRRRTPPGTPSRR